MSKFNYTFSNVSVNPPADKKTQNNASKTSQKNTNSTSQSREGTTPQQQNVSRNPQEAKPEIIDMEDGYLQMQAQEDIGHAPLTGANVTVWTDNEDKVLFQLLTDEYGKTKTVTLPAPARRYSLDIKSLIIPYSAYTVEIKYNAHSTNIYRHIQVFANTTTIQICNITLLPENFNPENVTVIPPHILVVPKSK